MALLYVEEDANAEPPSAAGMAPWMEFNQIAEAVGANTTGEPLQSTSTATPVRVRDDEMFRTRTGVVLPGSERGGREHP